MYQEIEGAKGSLSPVWRARTTDRDSKLTQRNWEPRIVRDFINAIYETPSVNSAILVLSERRCLLYANQKAEELLASGDPLTRDARNVVRCRDQAAEARLKAIATAKGLAQGFGWQEPPLFLAISRRAGWPLAACLRRFALSAEPRTPEERFPPAQIVMIARDLENTLMIEVNLLRSIFNFSHAEAKVVVHLAQGDSLECIAQQRRTSIHTVRGQVKNAQAKAGVCRQSQLVALALRTVLF